MPGSAPTHQSPASRLPVRLQRRHWLQCSQCQALSYNISLLLLSPFSTSPFLNAHAFEGVVSLWQGH